MVNMTFIALENCLSSGITGSMDAFSIANLLWPQIENGRDEVLFKSEIVSIDGEAVKANNGIILQPERSAWDIEDTDIIFIPGFLPPFNLDNDEIRNACRWLREQHKKKTLIASTCTGAFLLAESGILDGKIATTNWQMGGFFKQRYPDVELRINRIYTEDSGIFCTGAATAFMDLCIHFIKKYGSQELASRCSKALLTDPNRSSQSPYILYAFRSQHGDNDILKVQKWMEKNYADKFSMDSLADGIGMSPRHFKRRFKKATGESPLTYLQLLRIENAKRRLETTRENISNITWDVGYEDINSFRRLFKKHTGLSPKSYRSKFASTPRGLKKYK